MLILFKVNEKYYLHTGDFRYHPKMKNYLPLQNIQIEGIIIIIPVIFIFFWELFLDNTFCDPKFIFPSQLECIQNIIDIIKKDVLFIKIIFIIYFLYKR